MIKLLVDPVAKPRQTRADKWKKRPSVIKYRAFADQVRFCANMENREMIEEMLLTGALIKFNIPMPTSWSQKKKDALCTAPHKNKPDIDNLIKAVLDALLEEDQAVHTISATKVWSTKGSIEIWQSTAGCINAHR